MKDSISNTSQYLMAATGQTINSEDFVDEETVNAFSTSIGKSEIKPCGLASPKSISPLKI